MVDGGLEGEYSIWGWVVFILFTDATETVEKRMANGKIYCKTEFFLLNGEQALSKIFDERQGIGILYRCPNILNKATREELKAKL